MFPVSGLQLVQCTCKQRLGDFPQSLFCLTQMWLTFVSAVPVVDKLSASSWRLLAHQTSALEAGLLRSEVLFGLVRYPWGKRNQCQCWQTFCVGLALPTRESLSENALRGLSGLSGMPAQCLFGVRRKGLCLCHQLLGDRNCCKKIKRALSAHRPPNYFKAL